MDIEAGVSGIALRFPRDEGVRVTVSEGLSGVESGADWVKSRDGGSRIYESERFSSASAYWDVYIESAIGGITLQNAPQLIAAGVDLLAVITDLFGAPDIRARAAAYTSLFSERVTS